MFRFIVLPLACLVCISLNAWADKHERPNIIVIMCDDMGYSDIGCYGGEVMTPSLDSLAKGGMRFRQFYNTARCCPSRASLLTGLYPHQAGIGGMVTNTVGKEGYEGFLTDRGVTVAEVLKDSGYRTRMVGKWHVSPHDKNTNKGGQPQSWPLQRGFEKYYGTLAGSGSFYFPKGFMIDNTETEVDKPADYYYTDAISDKAVEFVHESADTDKPLFMYVAYTAPHWPLHALPEDIKKYENRFDAGWDVLRQERYQRMREMGVLDHDWPMSPREPESYPWEEAKNKAWETSRMAAYAAMIDRMDQGIGRIVKALKAQGEFENTLIMFIADNGGSHEDLKPTSGGSTLAAKERGLAIGWEMQVGNVPGLNPGAKETFQSYAQPWANLSNTPFRRYKKFNHEGGIASPLVVSWPAKIKHDGSFTNAQGHIIDLMPTCLDAAGATAPKTYKGKSVLPVEGRSLVPVFEKGSRKGHEYLYWEHVGNRAVRKGDWKLVMQKGGEWELYNMKKDRTELNDLSKEKPKLAMELRKSWEAWADRSYVSYKN